MATVAGVGTHQSFDLQAARELGITVCNVPAQTAPIVAEHALGLMLAAAKQVTLQTAAMKAGRWTPRPVTYLRGKVCGLVGAGNIARAFAYLVRSIGMEPVAWTFHPTPERGRELGVRFVSLDNLLETSDVISIHLRLTPKSRGLIGARELRLMKRGAILVNTARGPIVDSAALVRALREGTLGCAALDVFDEEPLPVDHPLRTCDPVVLTPHVADGTSEGNDLRNQGMVDNVIAFLEGRPQNVLNLDDPESIGE